jgi:hypothetical protein
MKTEPRTPAKRELNAGTRCVPREAMEPRRTPRDMHITHQAPLKYFSHAY